MTWTDRMWAALIARRDHLLRRSWRASRGTAPPLSGPEIGLLARLERAMMYLSRRLIRRA